MNMIRINSLLNEILEKLFKLETEQDDLIDSMISSGLFGLCKKCKGFFSDHQLSIDGYCRNCQEDLEIRDSENGQE